jgi:hypothetical protein
VARGGTRSGGLTRLRGIPRGDLLLGLAIAGVFLAVIVNAPTTLTGGHQRRRDRAAFELWAEKNGGRRAFGIAIPESHPTYDVVCAAHFRGGIHRKGNADYRIYLLIDSHKEGPARIVRVTRRPLEVRPTKYGPKCGKPPPPAGPDPLGLP